jgi:hypothetical protein
MRVTALLLYCATASAAAKHQPQLNPLHNSLRRREDVPNRSLAVGPALPTKSLTKTAASKTRGGSLPTKSLTKTAASKTRGGALPTKSLTKTAASKNGDGSLPTKSLTKIAASKPRDGALPTKSLTKTTASKSRNGVPSTKSLTMTSASAARDYSGPCADTTEAFVQCIVSNGGDVQTCADCLNSYSGPFFPTDPTMCSEYESYLCNEMSACPSCGPCAAEDVIWTNCLLEGTCSPLICSGEPGDGSGWY